MTGVRAIHTTMDYFSNPPPGMDLSEDRTRSNNAIGIVLFILSAIAVGLRVLSRTRYQHVNLALDDYLMFLGLVSFEENIRFFPHPLSGSPDTRRKLTRALGVERGKFGVLHSWLVSPSRHLSL